MRRHRKTGDNDDESADIMEEQETTETVETTEISGNEHTESIDSPNVIVCYKTYSGYDETYTEYLKDEDDHSAVE